MYTTLSRFDGVRRLRMTPLYSRRYIDQGARPRQSPEGFCMSALNNVMAKTAVVIALGVIATLLGACGEKPAGAAPGGAPGGAPPPAEVGVIVVAPKPVG